MHFFLCKKYVFFNFLFSLGTKLKLNWSVIHSVTKKTIKKCMSSEKAIKKSSSGGGQNFERRNVERLKFKIAKVKITKDEIFDSFIIKLIFLFFRNYLNSQNI